MLILITKLGHKLIDLNIFLFNLLKYILWVLLVITFTFKF